jgi:hypothetical protein
MQQPLKLEFTPQTAKVAQKSGYKLTSFGNSHPHIHSLEFAEPPKRRNISEMQPHVLYTQPAPINIPTPSMDAYSMAVAEADSFLNVGNLSTLQNVPDQSAVNLLPSSESQVQLFQPLTQQIMQTTSTQPTLKSPQPRLFAITPSSPMEEQKSADPPPIQMEANHIPIKAKEEELAMAAQVKSDKEDQPHYFELLYQPNEKQRKSYKNENRYILPNPLTIVLSKPMKEKKVRIDKGTVTVSLLYDTGEELEENREHILDGVKTRSLDKEKKAQFHLKVVETSDRNRFRLQFIVRFWINKVEHVEKIISHCFRVTSNKKSASIERPRPFAIKPAYGPTNGETEVWIRGKLFTDRANTSVTFGGKEAKVIETEDNILVCYAPPRDDLHEDTTVEVKVTNHKGDQSESFDASKVLEFTYLTADRKRKRVKPEPIDVEKKADETQQTKACPTENNNMLYCPPSPSAYPQLDDIVKNESELIDRLGYFFPSYFPMEAS